MLSHTPLDPNKCKVLVEQAAEWIGNADAIIIGAGAGMSVDSGLSAYYGPTGKYANEVFENYLLDAFRDDPVTAAAHRSVELSEVLEATPHTGYQHLLNWVTTARYGGAVYTTNVDNMFVRAGFAPETVYEVHGSRFWSQCLGNCGSGVFPTPLDGPASCPDCGSVARPNYLMFGDHEFQRDRQDAQWENLAAWFDQLPDEVNAVVVEIGAGTTVPTVRRTCERWAYGNGWPLLRINTDEPSGIATEDQTLALPMGAREALDYIKGPIPRT